MTCQSIQKLLNLIKSMGYGRQVRAIFWPWGMPWEPIYDHLGSMLCAKV